MLRTATVFPRVRGKPSCDSAVVHRDIPGSGQVRLLPVGVAQRVTRCTLPVRKVAAECHYF